MSTKGLLACAVCFQVFLLGYAQTGIIPAPKSLKVIDDSVTDTGFWLSWEPVSKADSYRVTLSPPTIGAIGIGRGITDKFTAVEGLEPDTEYSVSVIAVKGNDEGIPAFITQRTALPPPSDLFVVSDTVTSTEMVVGWSKVPQAESYIVEVSPSTGVSGPGRGIYRNSVTLRGMTPNTMYTISVRPLNWVGSGGVASVTQLTKLPPPSNVRVVSETVSHNSMSVHWDPVPGANTYEVTISPPDDVQGGGQGITDTYVILRKLKADTQYRVQVAASNAAGLSEYRQAIAKTLSVCFAKAADFTKDTFKVRCPARCARNQEHVYGTREYTEDSYICAAAVHDGRIDDNVGGEVVVKKRPGLPHYIGTGKNGVMSLDYGTWHRSFVFGLQIPQGFVVQSGSITHNSFTLEWDPVSGADSYRVSVIPELGVFGARAGIEETKATLSNLQSDRKYRVYLVATNTLETSEAAILSQYTALPGPKNVHIVMNSVTHDRMNVSWYPVKGASHYVIHVKAGETEFTQETKKVSAMVDGLQSGINYNIGVRAVNSVGPGEMIIVSAYTKLATPKNLEAESVNWHRMHVQWDAVSGATYYLVSTVPSRSSNASEKTQSPYIWLENLQSDTMYEIRVQAVNPHERSRSTTIKRMTALGAPQNVKVVAKTHNVLTMKWDKMKNADKYYLTIVSLDGKYGIEQELPSNKFTVTNLVGMTEYKIKIIARNKIGDGKPTISGITTLIPPPANLYIRASSIDPKQVEVTWSQLPEATEYQLLIEPNAGLSGYGTLRDNRALISGLTSGILYEVSVMAIVGSESGMNATSTFATGLPMPTNVRAPKELILPDQMTIEWDVVPMAKSYNLTYQNKKTSMLARIDMIGNTSIVLTGLETGTTYVITVYAVGESRQGTDTTQLGSLGASTIGITKLNKPEYISVTKNEDGTAIVEWNTVISATHYKVFLYPNKGTNGTGIYSAPEAQFNGLVEGQKYTAWLFALNEENNATSENVEVSFVAGGDEKNSGSNWLFPNYPDEEKEEQNTTRPLNAIDSEGTKEKINEPNRKEGDENNYNWIIIATIVICLGLLVIFAVIPCCCDCARNKPLLKFHGCCGCCSPCSDAGCCGCRGFCPSNAGKNHLDESDDDIEVAGGRSTPSVSRKVAKRGRRTHSKQSYNMY